MRTKTMEASLGGFCVYTLQTHLTVAEYGTGN